MGLKLPPLVKYEDFATELEFIEALYVYFKQDFIDSKLNYRGNELRLKRHPLRDDKECTFYHITTDGKDEDNRQLDILRAERLRWIKPIIESSDKKLKIWENTRRKENNILIFLEQENFLVIIRKRKDYLLFWTAYYVSQSYKKDLLKEHNEYHKKLKTPFFKRT